MFRSFSFFGLYLGVILCLLVWFLSTAGFLQGPSAYLYDVFARLTPQQSTIQNSLLLVPVRYDQRFQGDDIWLRLLETLDQKGARQVVFYFFPPNVSADFYQEAEDLGYVFFGRGVYPETDGDTVVMRPEEVPVQAAGRTLQIGLTAPSSATYGIHRDYQAFIEVEGRQQPHVTLLAARKRSGERLVPVNPFRVDFLGQHRPLPRIKLQRLFSEDIVQELVKGKTVLVGLTPPSPFNGYSTPLTPGDETMLPLEYHGLAFQTLLNRTIVRFPRPWEILACLVTVTGLALMIHQLYGAFIHLLLGGVLFVAVPLVGWLLLLWTRCWFPLVEVLLVYALFLLLLTTRDGLLRNRIALKILLDQSLKKQEKVMPKSFFRSREYWPLVANMVKQTLNLERSIFLEALEDDHRVREVIALNSSLDAIQERRRDYHRTPYKTAIEKNTAIRVETFFKSLPENEQPYLVPLNFFGQIQGFWAFTIDAEVERQTPELLNLVNALAQEIGELLHRRRQWIVDGKWRNSPLRKLLNMEKQHEPYHEINRITAFLVRRLSVLESVFNALGTGTILYNPFGMVVQSNRKMTQLLNSLNINAYGMSALDFAVHLTGESPERIRQLLGRVIVNHETRQLTISEVGGKKPGMVLKVRPLLAVEEAQEGGAAQPIEMNGYLFEIIELQNDREPDGNKGSLWLAGLRQIQDSLKSFGGDMEAAMIDRQHGSKEEQCRRLRQEYDAIIHSIRRLDDRMKLALAVDGGGMPPVDILDVLRGVIHTMEPVAEHHRIEITLQSPESLPLVLAGHAELMELLESVVSLLITDALDGSTLSITAETDRDGVHCTFANSGVGMPPEVFQRFLTSPGAKDRIEYQKIHRAMPELHQWRATLSGSSEFGRGLSFKLTLSPLS